MRKVAKCAANLAFRCEGILLHLDFKIQIINEKEDSMKKMIIFIIALSIIIIGVNNVYGGWDVYIKGENFKWKEYDNNNSKLLEEYGHIYGVGIFGKTVLTEISNKLIAKGKLEAFDGTVNYDGQTQDGSPIKTETDYRGNKIQGSLGWEFYITKHLLLEPFAGLGHLRWVRKIRSTENAIGYAEIWRNFYYLVGIYCDYIFTNQLNTFAEIEIKIPIDNELEIGLVGNKNSIIINPGEKKSIFTEAGLKYSQFKASIFYEGMKFSKSKVDTFNQIYQPKSEGYMYGLSIGIIF